MEQRRGHGYLYGTMVLAVGTVIVKLIGVFFKIPLTNILGGVGMSYFNVAYELYYPLYALFVSGVPVAVSKLVSESVAKGRARDAEKLLRLSVGAFVVIGIAGSALMYFGAGCQQSTGGARCAYAFTRAAFRLRDGGAARLLAGDAEYGSNGRLAGRRGSGKACAGTDACIRGDSHRNG